VFVALGGDCSCLVCFVALLLAGCSADAATPPGYFCVHFDRIQLIESMSDPSKNPDY
jgi:hypothetical protein